MAKLVSKKTTTTVTEEVKLVPTTPGEVTNHRFMKVRGFGTYLGWERGGGGGGGGGGEE